VAREGKANAHWLLIQFGSVIVHLMAPPEREFVPGNFGENLTLEGVPVAEAVVGERWRVGSALLEVSEPRFPCFKLGIRMGDPRFVKRFAAARRPGTYLRIVTAGDVGAGDRIELADRPAGSLTIAEFTEAYQREGKSPARIAVGAREPRQSPADVARTMAKAIERPRTEVWPYPLARWAVGLGTLLPAAVDRMMQKRVVRERTC
jgi:MOSC domain-containing protein YiiM